MVDLAVGREVMDSEYRLSEFAKAGTDIVTFLADAINPPELVEAIREADFISGLVFKPHQSMSSLLEAYVNIFVIKMEIPELTGLGMSTNFDERTFTSQTLPRELSKSLMSKTRNIFIQRCEMVG